jgi:hypothetical protein
MTTGALRPLQKFVEQSALPLEAGSNVDSQRWFTGRAEGEKEIGDAFRNGISPLADNSGSRLSGVRIYRDYVSQEIG